MSAVRGRAVPPRRSRLRALPGWLALLFVCSAFATPAEPAPATADVGVDVDTVVDALARRDRALIDDTIAAMRPATPGQPALYVVGVAGDGSEDVFRNEVHFLAEHVAPRLGAEARALALVNHPDSLDEAPRPLATTANLRHALSAIAARMTPADDVLLLYLTMHGTDTHELIVHFPPLVEEAITPAQLRAALDDAGIVNRVLVISACYSGGFVPALRDPDTLVITAARADRPSFGCGAESTITFFGHAWLLDGLNADTDFIAAFGLAQRTIKQQERKRRFQRSMPRIDIGERIAPRLAQLQAAMPETPPAVYPYPLMP
ncbi:C13 family peptidase [Luteimonas sp. BDR2-5]|uniref:C13 family peptidase n=1 Tax=Proluteimonas luteida TaxID=2878685 RepID=UPI001E3BBD36|nr:C13 family peptidase [Luteimonas sp. BDR2-5]MCD9029609.1 C13 family peptidase [Luteimonas sp. BDR2-5]